VYTPPGNVFAADSPELADVQAAIDAAAPGDTVTIPVGSATWAYVLVITKGILLMGAGIGNTVITSSQDSIVSYIPDAANIAADSPFRVSGFTFSGGSGLNYDGMIYVENTSTSTAITHVRVDHCRFMDSTGTAIWTQGQVYGVADNCAFDDMRITFRSMGLNRYSWDNFPLSGFGTADTFFLEDCTFSNTVVTGTWFSGGHGGRYVVRHCAGTGQSDIDILDVHGNQPGDLYATMMAEFYENTFAVNRQVRLAAIRGGQTLIYNNAITGTAATGSWIGSYEEYRDSICPVNDSSVSIQRPHDTYAWGNTVKGAAMGDIYISGTLDYSAAPAEAPWRVVPQKDLDLFSQTAYFDGASGVGVGLLAARPSSGLSVGVGYWATDTSTLYRATGATAWETYYTPYTYPHPLRSDAVLGD
jgi:hypothetical protein